MPDKSTTETESMEDILASIRETVEAEAAEERTIDPPAEDDASENMEEDLARASEELDAQEEALDAAEAAGEDLPPAAQGAEDASDVSEPLAPDLAPEKQERAAQQDGEEADDVLDLTDLVEDPALQDSEDDLVDIDAFAQSGEIKRADKAKAQKARGKYRGEDGADADTGDANAGDGDTSADTSVDTKDAGDETPVDAAADSDAQPEVVADAASNDAGMPEDEALAAMKANVAEDGAEDAADGDADTQEKSAPAPNQANQKEDVASLGASSDVQHVDAPVAPATQRVHLNTIPAATGLQVAFPAEVLAEALRPLVRDWVAENLPDVVERLVKEELQKLAEHE